MVTRKFLLNLGLMAADAIGEPDVYVYACMREYMCVPACECVCGGGLVGERWQVNRPGLHVAQILSALIVKALIQML